MKTPVTADAPIAHSGLIGFGEEEAARLNLVSLGGPDMRPWRLKITVFDALGKVVKQSDVEIPPGQSSSMYVGFQEVEEMPREARVPRKQFRLELVGFNPQPDPPGVVVNLEIFSVKTGATRFIGDPQISPNFPP
jgi:hypothetical protein